MTGRHACSGHSVNVTPCSSSMRVIQAPGKLPYCPPQSRDLPRATSSRSHQPVMAGLPAEVAVTR